MAILVSITSSEITAHLRRYESRAGHHVRTHEGFYNAGGISLANVEYYRERGAHQDAVRRSRAA